MPAITVTVPAGVPDVEPTVTLIVIGCVGNEVSGLTEVIWVVEGAGPALGGVGELGELGALGNWRPPALQARVNRMGTLAAEIGRRSREFRIGPSTAKADFAKIRAEKVSGRGADHCTRANRLSDSDLRLRQLRSCPLRVPAQCRLRI